MTQKQKDRARWLLTALLLAAVIMEIILFIARLMSATIFGEIDLGLFFGLSIFSFVHYITSDWKFGVKAFGQLWISALGVLLAIFYFMIVALQGLS